MNKKYSYTKEDVEHAVKESLSIANVLRLLGLKPAGGNYLTIKSFIQKHDIDCSHFTGQLWSKGRKVGTKYPLEDYLQNKRKIHSSQLRKRLLRENVKEHRCECCGNKEWMKHPIPLELDHIDGNHEDNSLNNIRLLCPNCHALTPTYRGRNIKPHYGCDKELFPNRMFAKKPKPKPKKERQQKTQNICCNCGKAIHKNSTRCSSCYHQHSKKRQTPRKFDPTKEELNMVLNNMNWNICQTGRHFGVSDNAIRKRCKLLGISKPKK